VQQQIVGCRGSHQAIRMLSPLDAYSAFSPKRHRIGNKGASSNLVTYRVFVLNLLSLLHCLGKFCKNVLLCFV